MRPAGIVLAGGASSRMGVPKASLDWHGTPLLAHVAAIVADAVAPGPVVVVHAAGQELPPLPAGVETVEDTVPAQGPLQALHDGLRAVEDRADAAFLGCTDAPFLHAGLVRLLLDRLAADGADAVLPESGGRRHYGAAAYRVDLAAEAGRLLAAGNRRLAALVDGVRTVVLPEAELRRALSAVDPELRALDDVDTPAEWAAALASGEPSPRR